MNSLEVMKLRQINFCSLSSLFID